MAEETTIEQQPPKKLSVDAFAAKIKEKYPDYAHVDNALLAKKIVEKYPQYAEQVDMPSEKKAGGAGSPLTSQPLPTGSPTSQDSQVRNERQVKQDALHQSMSAYMSSLSPKEQENISGATKLTAAAHSNDRLTQPTKEETDHYNFMQTPVGKTVGAVKYLASGATKGGLQVLKGVAHQYNTAFNSGSPMGIVADHATDDAFDKADKVADFGLTKGDQQRLGENKALSAAGMAAEFAPAVLGGEATGAPKALMFLQGVGQGKELADKIEQSGEKLNPLAKEALIQGSGGVNLLLSDLGGSMFGKLPSSVKGDVVSGIVADAIKKSAGKELTTEGYKALLEDGAKTFTDKLQKGGLNVLKSYVDNAKTFTKLNVGTFALHKAIDAMNDKPIFNETAGGLAEQEQKTLTQDAPIFSAIPALGAMTKLLPHSGYKNDAVESIMKDPSQGNIDALKSQLQQHGEQEGWKPEETEATLAHVDKIASVAKSLPKGLPAAKHLKAVDLILNRQELEADLSKEQEQRKQLDPAIQEQIGPHEQLLTDKIEQANDKLRDLATGTKTTHSKGVGDDEGNFFKTVNGKQEPIEESRYDLENLERTHNLKPTENGRDNQETGTGGNSENAKSVPEVQTNGDNDNQKQIKPTENEKSRSGSQGSIETDQNENGKRGNEVPDKNTVSVEGQQKTDVVKSGEVEKAEPEITPKHPGVEITNDVPNLFETDEKNNTKKTETEQTGTGEHKGSGDSDEKGITSRNNEAVDKSREKRGLPPLFAEQSKSNKQTWDEAMDEVDKNPTAADDLISRFESKPFAPNDVENAILLHRRLQLENEVDRLHQKVIDTHDKGEDPAQYDDQLSATSDKLQKLDEIDRKTGTMSGQSLQSRKLAAKNDFSLARLELRKRAANDGRPLTAEERADIAKVHADYEAKSKAYEAKIAELEERNRKQAEDAALAELKKSAKKERKVADSKQRQRNRQDLVQDIRNKLKAQRKSANRLNSSIPFAQQVKELAAISPELAKLAKSYIAEGIDKLDDLVGKIHDDLKEAFEGLDKRAVRDAISGYGKETAQLTKNAIQSKLEELRKQAKLISKIEDLEAKEYKATPKKKAIISTEIAELKKQAKELEQPDISLKSLKTRTANQIAEYQKRIADKDYSTKPPRTPTMLDPEAIKARGDLNRVKSDFEADMEKDRLANRGKFEKGLDYAMKYRRAELLLNLSGAAKVGMASAYRILSQPLHEIAGAGLRHLPILSRVAKMSPREGHGFDVNAEWKALKSVWSSETLAEVKKKFQGKIDNLDSAFGDKKEHFDINPLLDLAGNIHSAEKEFAKQNEFRRSVILRTKYAQEHGVDVTNPFVEIQIGKEALEDANRQIFMGENLANSGYKSLLRSLEIAKEDKFGKTGKITANVLKLLLPIVRVPTNFLSEKVQYTPVLGATRALFLMSRGISKLTPRQADYVMRVMKKQSLGAGLLALGYFNPQAFGGFRVPGGKRDENDPLKAGDIKIFGTEIPHWMTHTPLLSILQMGATIRRGADKYGETALATGTDIAESTPFYETPKDLIRGMESTKNMSQFAGNFLRGLLVPNLVNQGAQYFDTDSGGSPIKRNPKSVLEGIETGIPGLREKVGIKNPIRNFDKIKIGSEEKQLNNNQIEEKQTYYDDYMKSDAAQRIQKAIRKYQSDNTTHGRSEYKKLKERLHKSANNISNYKLKQAHFNPSNGGYDFEPVPTDN